MSSSPGPKEPSRPTVKRLFAVSGNRCASPKCATPLVDPQSGSIVGEVCHIKGDKPEAARYDPNQSNEERHGFDNLLLMCNVHHKVIDDDESAYTVERLAEMKKDHETRHAGPPPVDEATAERFVAVALTNCTIEGSVITTHGQTGGQTAHTIHNYYGTPPSDEALVLDCKWDTAGDPDLLAAIGCPGMRLTVICRSNRPAKIRSAYLMIQGVSLIHELQTGDGSDLGYRPLEGTTQAFVVNLVPLAQPNAQEGFVLNLDDVCRFFYPLPIPATALALRAKAEEVSVGVRFFDDTERTLLTGSAVKDLLRGLYEVYKDKPGKLNVPIETAVRVKSPTLPKVDAVDKLNVNYVAVFQQEAAARSTEEGSNESPAKEK
jgi:hypothetical protein